MMVASMLTLVLLCGTRAAWADATTAAVSDEVRQLRVELENMRQSNEQLRQQVSQIQASSNENWLSERRQEEVKQLVREVLSDADTRASLLEGGMNAGYVPGKGFILSAEDGSFLMNIYGQMQIRYMWTDRKDPGAGQDAGENGFTLRRMKVGFKGYIGSPKIEYTMLLASDRDTGNTQLEEGFVTFAVMDNLAARLGRFKAPFTREYMTSTTKNFALEGSYLDALYSAGYVEGAALIYTADTVRLICSVNDGSGSGNAASAKDFANDATDFAATGRADVKVMGDWKQWEEMTCWSTDKPAMFLGAAAHYQTTETGRANAGGLENDNLFAWTVDGSYKASGWNIYGAFVGLHWLVDAPAAGAGDLDHYGWVVQGGYQVIPDKLEPYARFEVVDIDGAEVCKIITLGANYYLNKHNAKFTVDILWALDQVPAGSTGVGLLADAVNQDNQICLRGQFQLLF
ncbi:MAG: hypothetical protein IT440_09390 [Phycisphaeraceae bacterium]|nr:hypothetical protein [Phycisphaeraceae bacterium]